MTNDITPEELTALRTYATLTAPIPKGWFEITRENSDGFDLDEDASAWPTPTRPTMRPTGPCGCAGMGGP